MARFLFILLLVLAGAVATALVFDHRSKRTARVTRLRSAFLHGTPLGGFATSTEMRDVQVGELRFRVPRRWRDGPSGGEQAVFQVGGPGSPTLLVRLWCLDGAGAADAAALQAVLRGLRPGRESAVQELAGGAVLLKCLEPTREAGADGVAYEWHLGRAALPNRVQVAQFTLVVTLPAADELTVQSDVSLLEREVRAASFRGAS
jgi:hypothetical protein